MCNRFQIVGSLLRPSNLLEYKHQIEHRDDISYPFTRISKGMSSVKLRRFRL